MSSTTARPWVCTTTILFALGALGLVTASASAALPIPVYSEDFESGPLGAEWTVPGGGLDAPGHIASITTGCTSTVFCTDSSGGSNEFLGRLASQTVTLTLTGLPAHDLLQIDFDLFLIASWDGASTTHGPDTFGLTADGGATTLLADTPLPGDDIARFETGTLGDCCSSSWSNHVYRFPDPGNAGNPHVFQFAHTGDSVTFEFRGFPNQACSTRSFDECWGIDNVVVTAEDSSVPVPELSTLVLATVGIVGLGAVALVRRRA